MPMEMRSEARSERHFKPAAAAAAKSATGLIWGEKGLEFVALEKRRRIIHAEFVSHFLDGGVSFVDTEAVDIDAIVIGPPIDTMEQVLDVLRRCNESSPVPKSGRPLRISWVLPDLILGGGGYRNIVRCAFQLERLGHDVSLHLVRTAESNASIQRQIREHFYPFEGFAGRYDKEAMGGDIVLATHWSTMKDAEEVASEFGEVIYFVQDFEPAFYPMGSEYLLAEETYRKGHYAITSGRWCEEFLKREFGSEADHFQFPIDRAVYGPQPEVRRQDRVLFFAKPEMPRRCFEIGVQALRHFHALQPKTEIAFFGSDFAHRHPVDFPVTQLGVLPTIRDLAHLYASSKVGLAFSTTNPSLVPYEMMACGLPVVDLARQGQEANYGGRNDIARLVPTDPPKMAKAIVELLADKGDLELRSKNGVKFTQGFPEESDVGLLIESYMERRVAKLASQQSARV